MKVTVLKEAGYEEALLGLSLSYNSKPSHRVASKLSHKGNGESKFLESMIVWLDVTAPRYWWQQFDTYRVGTTKQSGSTMHTIMKRELTQKDFQDGCDRIILSIINDAIRRKNFSWVKRHLPESFLQRRVVCTNYKTLQNMEYQRRTHRLPEWQLFLDTILDEVEHGEFIEKD